jgi:hypothetical protein
VVPPLFVLAAAASAIAQPALQPFAPLVGHCWAGPAPGNGTDRHCFEPVYGGQHVRDRHVVTIDGKPVYEGETLYSVHGRQVVFTYWNSLGGFGTGTADLAGEPWRFKGTIHATPNGKDQPMAASWNLTADGYEVGAGADAQRFKRAD